MPITMSLKKGTRAAMAAGILLAGLGLASCTPEKPVEAAVDPNAGYDIATVDYGDIIVLHPSYERLKQIDEELALLERKKQQLKVGAFEELKKEGAETMNKAVADAKQKLENEKAIVEREMDALSASLSGQIEGEMRGLQAQYQAELQAKVKSLQPEAPKPVEAPKLSSGTEGQIKDYMQNLGMVRERNLAARRLELERRIGDEVSSKKAEVDGQISAYESQLSGQYQNERVNLQLTAQNSTDEEAKDAAQKRLDEITQEIDSKKNAKRAELEGGYNAIRAEKTQQLQSELQAYQVELDREVAQKVDAKRREIGGLPAAAPRQPQASAEASAEVKAKIREIEGRMAAELEAKKAALSGQMKAKADQARARLEAKQQQVEGELKSVQAQIEKEIAQSLDKLSPETKSKIEKNDAKAKELQEQRKVLFEKMTADLNREIGEVAQKKDIDMVLGGFDYSAYPDLTDQAVVAVKQMENTK